MDGLVEELMRRSIPAFPGHSADQNGMSLLDYFAGQALNGIVAGAVARGIKEPCFRRMASDSYEAARQMLHIRGSIQ